MDSRKPIQVWSHGSTVGHLLYKQKIPDRIPGISSKKEQMTQRPWWYPWTWIAAANPSSQSWPWKANGLSQYKLDSCNINFGVTGLKQRFDCLSTIMVALVAIMVTIMVAIMVCIERSPLAPPRGPPWHPHWSYSWESSEPLEPVCGAVPDWGNLVIFPYMSRNTFC